MKIQSASLDVPGGCPNNCKYCVSELSGSHRMLKNVFVAGGDAHCARLEKQFSQRLEYLRDEGINTLVLTGTASEPHLNMEYLKLFDHVNRHLSSPFKNIEIQTSGISLDEEKLRFLIAIGVKTISLSLSSFNDEINAEINGTPEDLIVHPGLITAMARNMNLNVRLSLNMNVAGFQEYIFPEPPPKWCRGRLFSNSRKTDDIGIDRMFKHVPKYYSPDQLTFRKLYESDAPCSENLWIAENQPPATWWSALRTYIQDNGRPLNRLPFGAMKYSIKGMSVVVDDDCMSKKSVKNIKYLILRRNCKLYSEWDDPASLIF